MQSVPANTVSARPRATPPPPFIWEWFVPTLLTLPLTVLVQVLGIFSVAAMARGAAFQQLSSVPGIVLVLAYLSSVPALSLLAIGVVYVLFPGVRRRLLFRQLGLSAAPPTSPALTEIGEFIEARRPGTQVAAANARLLGLQAVVYPTGWRSGGIAVGSGLVLLWRRNRRAAEAILLHELGHLDQGDALIIGAGSLIELSIRVAAPLMLASAALPWLLIILDGMVVPFWNVYMSAGGAAEWRFVSTLATTAGSTIADALVTTLVSWVLYFLVPLVAIWSAELSCDRIAIQAQGGPDGILAALDSLGRSAGWRLRFWSNLTHPPKRWRRWMALRAPTWAASVLLLLVYPAGAAVTVALFLTISVLERWLGGRPHVAEDVLNLIPVDLGSVIGALSLDLVLCAAMLVAWPVAARRVAQLFGGLPVTGLVLERQPFAVAAVVCLGVAAGLVGMNMAGALAGL